MATGAGRRQRSQTGPAKNETVTPEPEPRSITTDEPVIDPGPPTSDPEPAENPEPTGDPEPETDDADEEQTTEETDVPEPTEYQNRSNHAVDSGSVTIEELEQKQARVDEEREKRENEPEENPDQEVPEGMVKVRGLTDDHTVSIYEQHVAHPDGEVMVLGGEERVIGDTPNVRRAAEDGRLHIFE